MTRGRSKRKRRLTRAEHLLLLRLIRGERLTGIARAEGCPVATVGKRLERMRKLVEAKTTFQLVALEVVNLMSIEDSGLIGALGGGVGVKRQRNARRVIDSEREARFERAGKPSVHPG